MPKGNQVYVSSNIEIGRDGFRWRSCLLVCLKMCMVVVQHARWLKLPVVSCYFILLRKRLSRSHSRLKFPQQFPCWLVDRLLMYDLKVTFRLILSILVAHFSSSVGSSSSELMAGASALRMRGEVSASC